MIIAYDAWIGVLILTLFALIGPPLSVKGRSARHTVFHVTLPPDEETERQGQSPAGRRTQELGEWRMLWLLAIATIGVPLAWAVQGHGPISTAAVVFVTIVGNGVWRIATNGLDIAGHGAEILVAEKEGREGYRAEEISRMLRDPDRSRMTAEQIQAKLRRWQWVSKILIRLAY